MSVNVVNATMLRKIRTRPINTISPVSNAILHVVFILYALACVLPLLLVISVSLTSEQAIRVHGYTMWPTEFSLEAYRYLFKETRFVMNAYKVTAIATLCGAVLCVINVALYAYPLSRKDFRFKTFFTFLSFFTMLFGGGLVPYYLVITKILNLYDTLYVLFVPAAFSAFWVLVMRAFYKSQIPDEVIESARIDGAGEWRTWLQIVIPLSIPGFATIGLFSTIGIWNDFFNCLLFTNKAELQNLQYLIYSALTKIQYLLSAASTGNADSNLALELSKLPLQSFRMAMAVVTVGPIILAYPYFQRFFIKGLTIGAVKG